MLRSAQLRRPGRNFWRADEAGSRIRVRIHPVKVPHAERGVELARRREQQLERRPRRPAPIVRVSAACWACRPAEQPDPARAPGLLGHVGPAEARGVPQQELAARTFRRATGDAFRLAATMGRFGESAKDWAFHFETGKALVFFKACEGPKTPERRMR